MKIAFFETEEWEKEYLSKKLSGNDLIFTPGPLTPENASQFKEVDAMSIFITSRCDQKVLDQLPSLRYLTTRSTGYDHIDLKCCNTKKITASNVPHYGTHTVAEHTFALILGLSRNIYKSVERTKHGSFIHNELTGFDLFGKTIGIVGLGDIGMSVLRIAKGFGMNVVAYAHHPDEKLARKLGITFLTPKELFAASDIVTLHLPYMKETHHIVNKKTIKKFKKGSLLINTARGPLVDTEAIVFGLEQKILAGVGLDVLEEEDFILKEKQLSTEHFLKSSDYKTLYLDHVLMDCDNVIITPHNAFNSIEALHMILDVTVENIINFEKQNPQNVVQ